jgi:hypothetical protein
VAYLFNVKFFVNFITRDLQIQKRRQIYVYCVNEGHLGGNNNILYLHLGEEVHDYSHSAKIRARGVPRVLRRESYKGLLHRSLYTIFFTIGSRNQLFGCQHRDRSRAFSLGSFHFFDSCDKNLMGVFIFF